MSGRKQRKPLTIHAKKQMRLMWAEKNEDGSKRYRLMLSLEPIVDFQVELVKWIIDICPEFVSIGANTKLLTLHGEKVSGLPEPSAEKLRATNQSTRRANK